MVSSRLQGLMASAGLVSGVLVSVVNGMPSGERNWSGSPGMNRASSPEREALQSAASRNQPQASAIFKCKRRWGRVKRGEEAIAAWLFTSLKRLQHAVVGGFFLIRRIVRQGPSLFALAVARNPRVLVGETPSLKDATVRGAQTDFGHLAVQLALRGEVGWIGGIERDVELGDVDLETKVTETLEVGGERTRAFRDR